MLPASKEEKGAAVVAIVIMVPTFDTY